MRRFSNLIFGKQLAPGLFAPGALGCIRGGAADGDGLSRAGWHGLDRAVCGLAGRLAGASHDWCAADLRARATIKVGGRVCVPVARRAGRPPSTRHCFREAGSGQGRRANQAHQLQTPVRLATTAAVTLPPMRGEIINIATLTGRQREAWRELAGRACVPNPFSEPDFVEAAVRGLGEPRAGVLVVTDKQRWRAAMPVLRVRRWRHVPGPLLVGWRHSYCFLTTPLVDRDDPEPALAALLARGAAETGVLGLMLDWVDSDGPIGAVLAAEVRRTRGSLRIEAFTRASLQRRPENDYLAQTVSKKRLRELRRLRRRLESEIGTLELHDRAGEPEAVAEFLALEQAGWKGRAATAMSSSSGADFFVELCDRYAASNRLQLLSLQSGQETVAMKVNLIADDGIFCFKIAFDERFARFSPGLHLEAANVDLFHAQPRAAWMDSCAAAENAMINGLWPDRRPLQSVLICPPGFRGAVGSSLWWAARSARAAKRRYRPHDDAARH